MTVFLAGTIPVIWLALKIAPYWKGNLFTVFRQMDEIFAQPLHIAWTEGSLRDVFLCLLAYAMGIFLWLSSRKNSRRGEEHGSARWGEAVAVNRKHRQKPDNMNKILTQHGETPTETCGHNGHKLKSRDALAEEYGYSSRNVARYLRINSLIRPFKDLVDDNKIALLSAVDQVLPEIIDLWGLNVQTQVESKKTSND